MKTKQEHSLIFGQKGSGLIYVLIAVALFAALSFTLMRTTNTGEAGTMSDDKAELYATQLINYTGQAKSALDQMLFSGANLGEITFSLPGTPAFLAADPDFGHTRKLFHPDGGGLIPGVLPPEVVEDNASVEPPGWYVTTIASSLWLDKPSAIVLSAHKIDKKVCEKINKKVTGDTTIPVLDEQFEQYFISGNLEFDSTNCLSCVDYLSLCTEDTVGSYGFYNVLAK